MAERIGQQVGNYRLISLLGHGGFAEVYLGEHVYLKTQAAIKMLQARLSSSEDLDSFLKEAQMIARLSHPNIVRILDFGVAGETPFLVMDYAPYGTLRQRHKQGECLPTKTVVQYVKQISDALQYAHDDKLIHRDVKPENMLVGRRNEILLSDFGIALIAQSSRYQSTQDVVGTVAYMSPEQIQDRPRPASDQYSLAIVVYEWLSGQRPFRGSFTELCAQHMFAPVPPLCEKAPAISSRVEQVVMTALAKEPKERFDSVRAFATALEQACDQPDAAQTSSSPYAPTRRPDPVPMKPASPPAGAQQMPPASPVGGSRSPSQLSTLAPEQPESGWRIGKQQFVAMIIGVLIYGGITFALYRLSASTSSNNFWITSIGNSAFLPSPLGILVGLASAIPLFFGARYGPWTGLVVSLVSSWLGTYFSPNAGFIWELLLAAALIGFIAGLAFLKTRGDYSIRGALPHAFLLALLALLFDCVFWGIDNLIRYHTSFLTTFSFIAISDVFALPLLLILLLLSARLSRRRSSVAR
jgi:serine/threonine protein kinase